MTRLTLYGIYQYDKTLFDGVELPTGIDKNLLINDIISTCGDLYTYYQVPPILKINITSWFKRRYYDFGKMYDALRAEYVPIENYNRTETRTQSDSMSGTDRQTNSTTSNSATQSTNSTTSNSATQSTNSNTNSTTDANTGTDSTDSTDSGNSTSEQSVSAYNAESYSNRERIQDTKSNSNNSTVTYNTTLTHNSTDSGTNSSNTDNTASGTNSSNTDNTASGTLTTDYGKRNDTREEVNVHGNIGVTTNQQMISAEIDMRGKYDLYRIITQEFEREFLIQIY